jgi:hypothetical protein
VLTSVTLKTFPNPSVMSLDFFFITPANNTNAFNAITYFVTKLPELAAAGISGYPIIYKSIRDRRTGGRDRISGMFGKVVMLDTRDPNIIRGLVDPIFQHINVTWPGFRFTLNTTYYATYYDWYAEHYDPSPVGHGNVMGSRLLDEKALTGNPTAIKAAYEKLADSSMTTTFIVSGKGVWNAKPRGGGSAVLPAWRKAIVHSSEFISRVLSPHPLTALSRPLAASVFFPPANLTARAKAYADATRYSATLTELAPDMGAYLNEVSIWGQSRGIVLTKFGQANPFEPQWQKTFWGENYPRLLEIKRKVDAGDVFWCEPCVGNERWRMIDNQLCRVAN